MGAAEVHFVGIGGIGMSALAQLYVSQGKKVRGSDISLSPVTNLLKEKGIEVLVGDDKKHLGEGAELLVFSDAVPHDSPERTCARERGIRELSYFEALGEATREGVSIVVAGTHGKTTTTAILAKLLIDQGKRPTVIAGSILAEHGSNFVPGDPQLYVIEGCEYKRHFLHLQPTILLITNIELDHTDYYRDLEDIQDAFHEVVMRVPATGTIITNTDSGTIKPVLQNTQATVVPYQHATVPQLLTPGRFSEENARAAKVAAYALDPDFHEEDLNRSLREFRGTWRRFEYKGVTSGGATVYDDYAHHPTAVKGTLETAKNEFKDKKIVVVFHPHLYSRTKRFFAEFAAALAVADKVILLPIYAAREERDPTVSSEQLVEAITAKGGQACYETDFETVEKMLKDENQETVIFTMGAGDVYQLADNLTGRKV